MTAFFNKPLPRLPARDRRGTDSAMNTEPKIRVVGKRRPSNYNSGGLKTGDNLLRLLRDLRGNRPFVPHGVTVSSRTKKPTHG